MITKAQHIGSFIDPTSLNGFDVDVYLIETTVVLVTSNHGDSPELHVVACGELAQRATRARIAATEGKKDK